MTDRAMTVKGMIEALQKMPPDAHVIVEAHVGCDCGVVIDETLGISSIAIFPDGTVNAKADVQKRHAMDF